MHIDLWTLGLQAINLLVLVWILSRFLFKPIAQAVTERQGAAAKLLDDAKAAQESARTEREEAIELQQAVAESRADILQAATQTAEKRQSELLASAQAEADKIIGDARAEIARMHDRARAELDHDAVQLAVSMTGKLLERLSDAARINGFIEGLAKGLTSLPPPSLAELKASGELTIKAARALTEQEKADCRRALAPVLGNDVAIQFGVDPQLIAGFALETPHVLVSNNFRADLDRIAQAMAQDEAA